MKVILTFYSGEVREFEVEKNQFVIGRSPKSDISVSVEGISRSHCLVEIEDGEIFITDLDSTNGVLIDSKKIQPNKRTLYNMFLNLSLGPIQSVQFDLAEGTSHKIKWSGQRPKVPHVERELTTTLQTKTRSLSGTGKFSVNQSAKKKRSIDIITVIKFLIPVIIFLLFFYYDQLTRTDEGSGETMGEEEFYSSHE